MFKKIFLTISLVVAAAVCDAAAQVPQSVLAGNVERCANTVYLYSHDSRDTEIESTDDLGGQGDVEQLYQSATECLAEVTKALAGGLAESRTVRVTLRTLNYTGNERPTRQMPVSEVAAMCRRLIRITGGMFLKAKAEKAAQYPAIWMKHITDGTLDDVQAEVAAANGKDALSLIDEAIAGGLAPSESIEVFDRKLTVAEAREEIVYVKTESEKVFLKNVAAAEAKFEPYRKALSGDKLELYNERFKLLYVYSTNGRILTTPQQYAAATLWCRVAIDRNGISPRWDVTCWRFSGMKIVGGPTTRTGWGTTPPSASFR
jgi:hypothetical protein